MGDSVTISEYNEIEPFVISQAVTGKIVVDPAQVNYRLYQAIQKANPKNLIERSSLIALPKSLKNDSELNGIRQSHIRDGVALTSFLAWLTISMAAESEKGVNPLPDDWRFTELSISEKLEEFRKKMDFHVSPSFNTIAGYGANGIYIITNII